MNIPRDKLLHIAMGVGAVAVALVVIELARHSLGAALALMTTTFGVFYEFNQRIRKEGKPEFWDAFCTALPGWAAWAILEGWRAMQ